MYLSFMPLFPTPRLEGKFKLTFSHFKQHNTYFYTLFKKLPTILFKQLQQILLYFLSSDAYQWRGGIEAKRKSIVCWVIKKTAVYLTFRPLLV